MHELNWLRAADCFVHVNSVSGEGQRMWDLPKTMTIP